MQLVANIGMITGHSEWLFDKLIEILANSCSVCQALHVDFARPFQGKMFFILVDIHLKLSCITEFIAECLSVSLIIVQVWQALVGF